MEWLWALRARKRKVGPSILGTTVTISGCHGKSVDPQLLSQWPYRSVIGLQSLWQTIATGQAKNFKEIL